MTHKYWRTAIGLLTGFSALTAIGGGVALLMGFEADRIPLKWVQGTPFTNYTIPALLLAVVVGGSSAVACVTVMKGHRLGMVASMLSGLIMAGYISIEVAILQQVPPGPTLTEYIYFGLGLVVFGLAGYEWLAENRLSPQKINRDHILGR
jgi:hypothetical protein